MTVCWKLRLQSSRQYSLSSQVLVMEKPTVLVEIHRRQTFELRLAAPLMINQISRIIRWSDKDSNLHEKFNGDEMTAIVL